MNRLPGVIAAVESVGSVALVDVDVAGRRLTATLIGAAQQTAGWQPGMPVQLLFAETEVALAKNLSGLISMRNRLDATVITVEQGGVLCKVVLDFAGHCVSSIITTRSSHALALAPGDQVEALVKANEMSVVPLSPSDSGDRGVEP